MRITGFILALAFLCVGPSVAGTSDGSLPGIGTFSLPSTEAAPAAVVARLTLAVRS